MKRFFLACVVLAALGGGYWWLSEEEDEPARSPYRTVTIERGDITAQVSATGTVSPITTVIVGSQLSGQIVEILADYNSEVKTGQLLARLNSDQIRARLDAARAEHAQAQAARRMLDAQMEKSRADEARADAVADDMTAQFDRVQTQLADAEKTLARQTDLSTQGIVAASVLQNSRMQRDTLTSQKRSAQAQIENVRAQKLGLAADRKILEAQMASSDAQVRQRAATVRQIEVDLANTDIRSPVDGVVVQRNVELGQPVAASLQAPTLFLVAQDLRRIQIQANVDEADVGRVKEGQPVSFTVNAFAGRTFDGTVRMVRLGSQTVQNVVIYTAVIDVENPRLELRPGMTATLKIITERRQNSLRVPNAALRWRPPVTDGAPAQPPAQPTAQPTAQPPGAATASADASAGPFAGGTPGRGGRGLFIERIKSELDLNAEQRAAVDTLLLEMPDSGRTGGPDGGRIARAAFNTRLIEILTEDQKAKFAAMRERVRANGSAAGGGRGGARAGAARTPQGTDDDGEGPPPRAAPDRREANVTGRLYRLGSANAPVGLTVRLGSTDGAYTEILSGVNEGDRIITGGGAAPPRRSGFRFGF